ncbi:hypothetical protein EB118_21665 [bacterium]|nr:hypothetical protein [Actinomycetota bacterium]NDG32668.1 hypothetical protein [bacterium]
MKKIFKKIFGIEEMERAIAETRERVAEAEKLKEQAEAAAQKALEEQEESKLSAKERATRRHEPWVGVLDTHVNKDNIRNGFFELDWNEYFIVQLKQAGYGFDGDKEEEIVDRWFRDIVRNILAEEGQDVTRGAGFVNVSKLDDNRSEVK